MREKLLTAYFRSGDAMRSRSVSEVVLSGTVDVPMPPARLTADWEREIASRLALEAGEVEPLPLPRARARWPDYRHCVQAVADWARTLGLPGLPADADVALMACRGARYHHDGARYGGAAFCNLFLSEDKGLDLHFPAAGQRLPLVRGTVVLFDTGQPHAVVRRRSSGFDVADFAPGLDCTQVFLTWELPIEDPDVGRALRVAFDVDPSTALQLDEEQLRLDGARAVLCPDSGRWCSADGSAAHTAALPCRFASMVLQVIDPMRETSRMTNESDRRDELKRMVLCASCAGVQRNWRRAPGHAELVQMSSRKAERSDGDGGGHTVTLTSYRCDACGTRWEYENDRTNQQAGWSVVGQ